MKPNTAIHTKQPLAIHGGTPVRTKPFVMRKNMHDEEKRAVLEVMDSDCLSGFIGGAGEYFLGGPKVKEFEAAWSKAMECKHTISVNSWTTGLMACVGAAGIEPGDEVICAPYSMSASATAILFYGGIPVFADIEPDYFCLDPVSVEKCITPRTKAIMVVHLFGGVANMDALMAIAKKHSLKIIEDAAQAPKTLYKGRPVGAIGHIGGHSLNRHKHIHTGEGGMITTDDDTMAKICQMIRNHGENASEAWEMTTTPNIMGSNYRFTELQAAIGLAQLPRLDGILAHRQKLADYLDKKLAAYPALTPPPRRPNSTHAYYLYPIVYDETKTDVSRTKFISAVNAELPVSTIPECTPLFGGYGRPLYLNPIYQNKIVFGKKGFPYSLLSKNEQPDYSKGICPVVERMYDKNLMISYLIREPLTTADLDDFVTAIDKVMNQLPSLADTDKR